MTVRGILVGSAVLFGAVGAVRKYKAFCEERMAASRAILGFIKYRGELMSRFSSSKSEICKKYEDEILEKSGFLPTLREGKSFIDALRSSRKNLPLSDAAIEILETIFAEMGNGYLDEERQRQKAAELEMAAFAAKEKEELERDVKVKTTLILAAALGAIILIL